VLAVPLFHRPKPALADVSRPHRAGAGGNAAAFAARAAIPEESRAASSASWRQARLSAESLVVRAISRNKSTPDHPRFGAMVPAGPRHLRHRNVYPHHPRHTDRRQHRSSPQRGRAHSARYPGDERRRVHRRAADRGDRLCRAAYRPRRPHPAADSWLHRLRRAPAARGAFSPRRRNAVRRAPLRRVHGVQLHDKYRPERDDLSDRGRGVSHFDPRRGRGFCGLLRQNRRSIDRVPVPDPAQGYRHRSPAVDLGRHQPCRGARHLALRHRNQGH
jgi:hypothetical protein